MRLIYIVFFAAALAGCATPKPEIIDFVSIDGRGTQQALTRDNSECEYDAKKTTAVAPLRPVNAGNNPGVSSLASALVLRDQEDSLFFSCMRARGWTRAN